MNGFLILFFYYEPTVFCSKKFIICGFSPIFVQRRKPVFWIPGVFVDRVCVNDRAFEFRRRNATALAVK